jgi:hypothetical protein
MREAGVGWCVRLRRLGQHTFNLLPEGHHARRFSVFQFLEKLPQAIRSVLGLFEELFQLHS